MDKFEKQKMALRYWLIGKKYYVAIKMMELASKYHVGKRKDGVTPEFAHQISIASYARTIHESLLYPEETVAAILGHDLTEDYDISKGYLSGSFGDMVANPIWLMSKKYKGEKKELGYYYDEIAGCPIASIGKGGDRIHNFQSMIDVFTFKGQVWYIEETEKYILPMLKKARRSFPEQESAYENIKHVLVSQIELIRAIHKAREGSND